MRKQLHPNNFSTARKNALKEQGISYDDQIKEYNKLKALEVKSMKRKEGEELVKDVVDLIKSKGYCAKDNRTIASRVRSILDTEFKTSTQQPAQTEEKQPEQEQTNQEQVSEE